MSVLTEIIGYSNYELVRSQIASLLAEELTNQSALITTALLDETDEDVIAAYEFTQSAIPDKVWEERFKRPQPEEYQNSPIVNVMFASAPLNELQTFSTQNGDNTYIVEVYAGERETSGEVDYEGDALAAMKLQRILALCRAIIMNPNYQYLGFDDGDDFIGKVSVSNIQISQPNDGNDNSANLIYGRFNVTVKVSEPVEQNTGTVDGVGQTNMYLDDDDNGYYWTSDSN